MVKLNKQGDTETLKDITTSIKTLQKKFGLPRTGTMNGAVANQLSNLGESTSSKGTGGTATKSKISNKDLIAMNPVKMILPFLIGSIATMETPQKVPVQAKLEKAAVSIGATYMVINTLDNFKDLAVQNVKNVFFADGESKDAKDVKDTNDEGIDEWEDLYDDAQNNKRIGKQKGEAPRDNTKQNEQADKAGKLAGLNESEIERFHRAISGQGYSYQDLVEIAKGIKEGNR